MIRRDHAPAPAVPVDIWAAVKLVSTTDTPSLEASIRALLLEFRHRRTTGLPRCNGAVT